MDGQDVTSRVVACCSIASPLPNLTFLVHTSWHLCQYVIIRIIIPYRSWQALDGFGSVGPMGPVLVKVKRRRL
jgi:hypothetical protein